MKIKKAELIIKPNKLLIPVTQLKINRTNAEIYNTELDKCIKNNYHKIIRTNSGGISYKTRFPAYDYQYYSSGVELTVLDKYGMFRLQFRNSGEKKEAILSGHQAFQKFKKLCLKYNIDLDKLAINNGSEIKKQIETYIIKMENDNHIDKIFYNAHHADFHSSFPSGLIKTHPEFKPVIEELYNKRKTDPIAKLILNATIGYMQSEKCCKAKWAHLSRDSIKDNNDRIRNLAERLKKAGRTVIAYNTDGIWYSGDIYHDIDEGTELGTWANDHVNCQLRFKSAGSYEFIEDNQYFPIVRGHTLLDEEKPREDWKWGDIYQKGAEPTKFGLTTNGHIVLIGEDYEIR